ncbi:MAG: hypothetical protein ACXAD7_03815 [Candidatus Kariarchaeaceae archaeon]|jgi:chromosome segregation ATPase
MSKLNTRLTELQEDMQGIVAAASERSSTFTTAVTELQQAIVKREEEEGKLNDEIGKLTNELKLLEENINDLKTKLKSKKDSLSKLEPTIKESGKQLDTLKSKVSDLETRLVELNSKNESDDTALAGIVTELEEKEEARSGLEASIEEKVAVNQKQLDEKKAELDSIKDKYLIWDYLLSRIDQPEVEIMAVIASNRHISTDEIKQKATSVSPVFVGRAISKLEADEKIVQDAEGKWDISPSLLGVLD